MTKYWNFIDFHHIYRFLKTRIKDQKHPSMSAAVFDGAQTRIRAVECFKIIRTSSTIVLVLPVPAGPNTIIGWPSPPPLIFVTSLLRPLIPSLSLTTVNFWYTSSKSSFKRTFDLMTLSVFAKVVSELNSEIMIWNG